VVSRLPTPRTKVASTANQPSARPRASQADMPGRGRVPPLCSLATARSCRTSRTMRGETCRSAALTMKRLLARRLSRWQVPPLGDGRYCPSVSLQWWPRLMSSPRQPTAVADAEIGFGSARDADGWNVPDCGIRSAAVRQSARIPAARRCLSPEVRGLPQAILAACLGNGHGDKRGCTYKPTEHSVSDRHHHA
jgi:hypothetical protein